MVPVTIQRILLVALFFAMALAYANWVMGPVHDWAVVRAVYTGEQIRRQDIRVAHRIPPRSAVYSNGERHDHGRWPGLLSAALWLAFMPAAFVATRLVARLFLPAVYAELVRNGAGAASRPPDGLRREQP